MRASNRVGALELLVLCTLVCGPQEARAWGDEGHAIIALIAEHYLDPRVLGQVRLMLDADTSGLVADQTMAGESVWADRYRDSDRDSTRLRYQSTRGWHYVDIELDAPNLNRACLAGNCVVAKIDQFQAELADAHAPAAERLLALQFLLHLVGDLHQPLHAADEHDQGGNLEQVDAPGLPVANLHRYWDVEFVRALGPDPGTVAASLIDRISTSDLQSWRSGSTADWAWESYSVAKSTSFGLLPPAYDAHRYHLSSDYERSAVEAVRLQLERAGVRLALILNRSL
jgi:hypothetical protein